MNFLFFPLLLFLVLGFHKDTVVENDLEKHFKDYGFEGSFLLYDFNRNEYISYNEKRCRQGFLPASTYKIPNSLFALEAGILTPTDTIFWNGKENWNPDWNRNHVLKSAFSTSCVPCYQEFARQMGPEKMQEFVTKAGYGKMDIKKDNIDTFWLTGKSRISQFEQIEFLTRLYRNQLPFSTKNMEQVKEIMIAEKNDLGVLRAKTGLTTQGERHIGWYVGYLEQEGNVYFFATNIEKLAAQEDANFIPAQKAITLNILKDLNLY